MIHWGNWLIWGFISTLVLTIIMAGSQGAGVTRMNITYLLGTIFTPNRDRAKIYGFLLHLFDGWVFSLLYILAFTAVGFANWWLGAFLGLIHALFVLTVGMPLLPGIHPRMANEQRGPDVVHQLEPPGFFALHYGRRTPISIIIAHIIFGAMLGIFYTV